MRNGCLWFFRKSCFEWDLRNEENIFFWEDIWCREEPLASYYWRLYSIFLFQNYIVKELKEVLTRDKELKWNRNLIALEVREEQELLNILNSTSLTSGEDRLIWTDNKTSYTAKKGYQLINAQESLEDLTWGRLWKLKVLPKISVIHWKMVHEVLPTNLVLSSRIPSVNNNWCTFWQEVEESNFYLLWSCLFSKRLWKEVALWWNMDVSQLVGVNSIWDDFNLHRGIRIM